MVWRWDNNDPFGANVPDEDPDGDRIKFTCNLRFPGQYADRETFTHYNYFRDYDPSTGRYIQSDLIGLQGGINTYIYVNGNPVNRIDPRGLVEVNPEDFFGGGFGGPYNQTYYNEGYPSQEPQLPPLPTEPLTPEKCKAFLNTCYATAGGSGLGLNQVIKSVVTAAIPQARITATIAGAVGGAVAGQNLSLQCQKAYNQCIARANSCSIQ